MARRAQDDRIVGSYPALVALLRKGPATSCADGRGDPARDQHSEDRSDDRPEQSQGGALTEKIHWICPRVAPSARRIPISERRCVTAIANEL